MCLLPFSNFGTILLAVFVPLCDWRGVSVCVCVNQRSMLDVLFGHQISFSLETASLIGLGLAE